MAFWEKKKQVLLNLQNVDLQKKANGAHLDFEPFMIITRHKYRK